MFTLVLVLSVVPAIALGAILCVLGVGRIRRALVSQPTMRRARRHLPSIADTERVALDAGTVWWEGELFTGRPDWTKFLHTRAGRLTEREEAFLAGPVQDLCGMIDEWEVEQTGDLPEDVWSFIKKHRFFGIVISEAYGGLGFSALAHSAIITKIASRSITAAVTVMVPNSLGPAELVQRYGTEMQRKSLLPRLAAGLEIPCFALTESEAGSDAASLRSHGVVCFGIYEGRRQLGMRLTWNKRYTTLAPKGTLLGLAFRLRDPDRLLGDVVDIGITVALIPTSVPGITIGRRHDPMGLPFQNGPHEGKDVFVPLDYIIGGPAMAGQGWRMLMESLAAGRSISLPALSVGAAELATRITAAYATVREQFGMPIGRFEGVEEVLCRIGGLTYMMNAVRTVTASAVDAGEHPAIASAIAKAYTTECMRVVVNDSMDILAGAGVCRGPRNALSRAHSAVPIGITVEGANILTRSLIIYGQGALRCHPWLRKEIAAIVNSDVHAFDAALVGHLRFAAHSCVRAVVHGLTAGLMLRVPAKGTLRWVLRRLTRASIIFSVLSDAAMLAYGPGLKRKEKVSGRFADALAWMYFGSAAAKAFHDAGQPASQAPFVEWSCRLALFRIEQAFLGTLRNWPNRFVGAVLSRIVFPFGARNQPPSDGLGAEVAHRMLDARAERLLLTRDIYVPPQDEPGLGKLELALSLTVRAEAALRTLRYAVREGRLKTLDGEEAFEKAVEQGILSREEVLRIQQAMAAREDAIRVDAFGAERRQSRPDEDMLASIATDYAAEVEVVEGVEELP